MTAWNSVAHERWLGLKRIHGIWASEESKLAAAGGT